MKQLSDAAKITLRDQIDDFELSKISHGADLVQHRFDKGNIIDALDIRIKKALKKIELCNNNIKALNSQIRNGVPDGDNKKMAEDETETKDTEEETTEDKTEDKTEDSEDKEKTESEDESED